MEKYTEDLLKRTSISYVIKRIKFILLYNIYFSANIQSNISILNSASINNNESLNNSPNADQIQWPTLYSSVDTMSLDERRMKKQQQQRSQQIPSSTSMQNYNNQIEQPRPISSASNRLGNNIIRPQGHGRSSYYQQNTNTNNFFRHTSVTPRILNSTYNDEQHSNQSPSTYFGSGSNVGRGRPMTSDH